MQKKSFGMMKFLVVGMGSIGRRHFENCLKLGLSDGAIVRRSPRRDRIQKEFLKKYRPKVFYDLSEALRRKPNAVIVANPTSMHLKTAHAAVRAGAHVFLEKPFSHTMSGGDALLQEAARRKKIIYVGYNFRYHPQLKFLKKYIDAGKLGTLVSARMTTGEYLPLWHPWEDYRKGYSARSSLGGGVVLTQSHDLDAARWFFGKPKKVSADIRTSGILNVDVDDSAEMMFSFERCPAVSIHLDYLARPPIKRYTIIGTKGRAEWDFQKGMLRIVDAAGRERLIKNPKGFGRNAMYMDELRDFFLSVENGRRPESDGISGKKVLEMCVKAKEASRRGQTVSF